MCCFSVATPIGLVARLFAPKIRVSATSVFARMIEPGIQALAYGMNLESRHEVAMVLPLPVPPGSGEDAVAFVDLSSHPRLFEELGALFTVFQTQRKSAGLSLRLGAPETLVVYSIGSFVASYVPTRADFARLDPRFRLPDVLFDAVPHYGDYGFAVFQLAPGKVTVHPMAMRFPTRSADALFFPTVHVHDGRFRPTARFDHALYYQTPRRTEARGAGASDRFEGDEVGSAPPGKSYAGLVAERDVMFRRTLRGRLPNQDTWIAA